MNLEISIADHLKNDFAEYRQSDSSCYGFYDWFCRDTSLKNKSARLISRLKSIVKANNNKFDPAKTYVFFKNNCPLAGPLYDDIRICDIETGNVLYTIVPNNGYTNEAELYCWLDDNVTEPVVTGKWSDIKRYFAA